ncbi:MAG: ZIP family metal transporter [Patescibacteria group bacterium]
MTFLYIFIASLLISLCALVGVFTMSMKEKFLNKILLKLVALSSGALLGGAFIHLMPEGIEKFGNNEKFFFIILISLMVYLLIEKILHWRHCHAGGKCPIHSFGYMNLLGDGVHNFIDGLIIASSFMVSIPLGITTTIAIALHEIPQEVGDFGVLLYAGIEKKKALLLNFLVALTVVAGAITGWFLLSLIENITSFLLPVAAGGFIYIALSDMIPELRKEHNIKQFFVTFAFILLGILLMLATKMLGGE